MTRGLCAWLQAEVRGGAVISLNPENTDVRFTECFHIDFSRNRIWSDF